MNKRTYLTHLLITVAIILLSVSCADTTTPNSIAELRITTSYCTSSTNNVTLTWDDPKDSNLYGIEVHYKQIPSFDNAEYSLLIAPGEETATIENLPFATYLFTVTAIDQDGNRSQSKRKEITTQKMYAYAVNNLIVTSNDKAINFSWENPTNDNFNTIKLKIETEDNASPKDLSSTELDLGKVNTYTFTTGEHCRYYFFTIYAVDKEGSYSTGTTYATSFFDYSKFNNPVMFITLPSEIDEITTKIWLEDQGIDFAKCKIYDPANSSYSSSLSNSSTFKLDIKGRGNTSWGARIPKKSYSLKLDKKENLFGIANGKHKNYALIANYNDKTLIRNQLAYYMGTNIYTNMDWNPHTQQVNLVINGKYYGIYLLTERIKINKNLIDITSIEDIESEDFSKGGWLVEVNARMDETFNWYTKHGIPISLKDPSDYSGWRKIKNYLNQVEGVLYGENFIGAEGWRKYLDEDSFIDWYLVNEIAKNNDANWLCSVYMYYNPTDGKIHMGPLWDFDIGFGNIDYNNNDSSEGFWIKDSGWYARLFQDPTFTDAVKARWIATKSQLDTTLSTISTFADKLYPDTSENFSKWQILGHYVWPNPSGYENRTTYQSEVDYIQEWITARIEWLDSAIMAL